ncbi:MAG: polysaccharide deacetylase family protein, partial [Clostridia bacterium]|nr:polysaccharide deacetylase family protein [Clostridia bacterium]
VLLVLGFLVNTVNIKQTYFSVTAPLSNGKRDSNQIGLMFIIDEPSQANNLPTIMETLKRAEAKATFFFTGSSAINNLELLQTISQDYELGNYGFSNTALNTADKNLITEEIRLGDALINSLVHKQMKIFTPPNGLYNKHTLAMAQNLGYTTVLPTNRNAVVDWENADSNIVLSYATFQVKAGDIIALKTTTATMKCFSQVAAKYITSGLRITSLEQLLRLS